MTDKIGRNDPCRCGSGKKYKSCCWQKDQNKGTSLVGRKFTAKVLSAGGANKPQQASQEQAQAKGGVDYATLMERSFGQALHSHEDKPPVPQNPSEYLAKNESEDSSSS